MNCDDILNRICDDLSEDINSQVCQEIKTHLESCENCRAHINSMKNAVNLYKCLEEKNVPPVIHERLVKMLNLDDIQSA